MDSESTTTRFRRHEGLVSRTIADETLLVPVHGDVADLQRVFALNEVGAFLWAELQSPRSLAELSTAVEAAFDVDAATALADSRAFLDDLLRRRLAEAVA